MSNKIIKMVQNIKERVLELNEKKNDYKKREADEIFSLFVYSLVFLDWQVHDRKKRGHNIAAILVNNEGEIVSWALNTVIEANDFTQHSEVRLITNFLKTNQEVNRLSNFTVYVSLEPCFMCSGMMALTSIGRVVYGQKDDIYGGVITRLNRRSFFPRKHPKYPMTFDLDPSPTSIKKMLDKAYNNSGSKHITNWLSRTEAFNIYANAYEQFLCYKVNCESNKKIYKGAKKLLEEINLIK